ncbi:MAG: SpoIID/LytB domain-containing protein [Clostridia bacterium]|nr:SpoIID/LytB domain-containing protein [Clostridia bacterium]
MKRPFRIYVICVMLIILLSSVCGVQANAQMSSTIRVLLKRLKVEDVLRIDVQGTYMLGDGSMLFSDGAELTIALRDGRLVLHADQMAAVIGEEMRLVRCEGEKNGALRLNESDGLYEGDLHLSVQDGVIRPILHIYIEDYLLGVVPYEMGDSFPLEALKAQAIAARTYALKRSGDPGDYDVEDTTNDQAFKGRSDSSPLSEQAVVETEGLCGTYKGELADCYYSASNGGQTELGDHVWPTDEPDAYGYMDMRDDPFDYENDASTVKRFTIRKKPGEAGVGSALHSALVAALKEPLEALGHTAEDSLVRFDEVVDILLTTPKFEEPSRLMTQVQFDVRLSVREYTFRDTSVAGGEPAPVIALEPLDAATPAPTPKPTATPAYSPYQAIDGIFSVTLPLFPDAEKAMGLSINVYQNELMRVVDIGSAFMLESRRFGHGVGMSQRGAQQMAGKYGMTCEQILSFYYPGMAVMRYQGEKEPLPTPDMELMATPAPTPSPTPRPTLMPVTREKLPKGAYIAVVSNISEESSLNLRERPSLSSDVLRRLYKNQELIVLEDTKDGWSHVKTDVIEGYVRSEYLQTAE